MANYTGLIPKIRKAEARLKTLNAVLERETGVTEFEGLLLARLTTLEWTNYVKLNALNEGWSFTKTGIAGSHLAKKGYIDFEYLGGIRFRINRAGRETLTRFKAQLEE